MQVIGVSIKDVMQEIIVPTMLPAIPMAVALYTMEVAWQPASLPSIAVTAGVGVLIYGAVYLSIGASFSEQKAFYDFVDSAIRRVTARRRHS
jgi:hypothetical protein